MIEYINASGATINEIYDRDNNVIQINYQKEERETNAVTTYYNNIMFRYTGKKATLDDCDVWLSVIKTEAILTYAPTATKTEKVLFMINMKRTWQVLLDAISL